MENFNFEYNKYPLKRIRCIYNWNHKVDSKTTWEGYILVENCDGLLNIKGFEIDNMDSHIKGTPPHKRYICGKRAISYADKSLIFTIYPGNIAPIEYKLYYYNQDNCFFGDWFFASCSKYKRPSIDSGAAAIYIEDVETSSNNLNQEDVESIKKEIAELEAKTKKEYEEYIKIKQRMRELLPNMIKTHQRQPDLKLIKHLPELRKDKIG